MMRRNDRARSLAVLAMFLPFTMALSSGCLFPPVATDATDPDEREPGPVTTTGDGFVTRSGQQTREGTVGPGFRVGQAAAGAESVMQLLALPPRVTSFVVTLDWSDDDATGTNQTGRLADLDLGVVIEILRESGQTEQVWGPANNNEGSPGDPDAPAVIASEPGEPALTVANQTTLSATITPESSTGGVNWVLTVEYLHLVTRA